MITAQEARQNVLNKEIADQRIVEEKVTDFLKQMDTSIQYHSRQGITELTFTPYDDSRFPSVHFQELAQELFRVILNQNGYDIVINNIDMNILKIKW